MRVHPVDGRVVHGIGGEGVFLNDTSIAAGGGLNGMPDWLDGAPIWCGLDGWAFTFVRGSQVGAWAGWTPQLGVSASWGLQLPKAVLLDMAPDGTMLVGDNYQSGVGISAYRPGDTHPFWQVPAARPEMRFPYSQAAILDAQTACWTENVIGRMVLVGYFSGALTIGPRPPWNVLHVRMFRVNGEPWVVYLRGEDDRTIAHPWDYRGLGFSVPGFGFGPDARAVGDAVTLYWSIGAGEKPGEVHSKPFDATTLDTIPSLPAVVPIAPNVPHFQIAGYWVTDATAPGNLAIGSPTYPAPKHAAVIEVPGKIELTPEERRAGVLVYIDGKDSDDVARQKIRDAVPLAQQLRLPICAYDDPEVERHALIVEECASGGVPLVYMPKWYLNIGEKPIDFAKRIIASAKTYVGRPFIPVIRAYCALNKPTPDPATWFDAIPEALVVEALNELVRQGALTLSGFVGPLFFAWDREDGAKNRPAVKAAADLWMKVPTTMVNGRAFADQFLIQAITPLAITINQFTSDGQAPLIVNMFYTVTGVPEGVLAVVEMLIDGEVVGRRTAVAWSGVLTAPALSQAGEYRLKARVIAGDRIAETGAVRIIRVLPAPPVPEIPGITYPTEPGSGTVEGARKAIQEAADAARKEESGDQ